MRVLLKIPELWVHTASHTEDDLHQFTKLSKQVRTRADFT
jgi:hypothetical protein